MKARTFPEQDMASFRINKEEWESIKKEGDGIFKKKNIGYISFGRGIIKFDEISPLFKDKKHLDDNNEEFSEEEKKINKKVADEIAAKSR